MNQMWIGQCLVVFLFAVSTAFGAEARLFCETEPGESHAFQLNLDRTTRKARVSALLDMCVREEECPKPPPQGFFEIAYFPIRCTEVGKGFECVSTRAAGAREFRVRSAAASGQLTLKSKDMSEGLSIEAKKALLSGVSLKCSDASKTESITTRRGLKDWKDIQTFVERNPTASLDSVFSELSLDFKTNASVTMSPRGLIHGNINQPGLVLVGGFNAYAKNPETGKYGNDRIFPDGKITFLALSAMRSGSESNKLDVMEYDPAKEKLGFFQVIFPDSKNPNSTIFKSPAKCLECHERKTDSGKSYFTGIWDFYPNWVSFHGSSGNPKSIEENFPKPPVVSPELMQSRLSEIRRPLDHGWGFVANSIVEEALSSAHELQYFSILKKELLALSPQKRNVLLPKLEAIANEDLKYVHKKGLLYTTLKDTLDFKSAWSRDVKEYKKYIRHSMDRENEFAFKNTGEIIFPTETFEAEAKRRYNEEIKPFITPSDWFLVQWVLKNAGLSLPALGLTHPVVTQAPSHPLSFTEVAYDQFRERLNRVVQEVKAVRTLQ